MKALVLTFSESRDIIFRSLAAGAHGYLLKSTPREELAEAIRSVHHGGAQISQQVLLEMVRYFRDRQNLQTKLTAAEQRVLAGREEGRSLKEIADELRVTVDTVKFHIKHILDKLGASSSAEAAYLHKRAAML